MPDPTDGLTPAAAAQMGMLLDSLGAVEPTREQIQALRWLSGWEVHTVHAIAALLRTTGTRRSLTTAVHPCPHTGVYAEADTTETPLRVIADDGNDLDGIVVQVHLGRCTCCEQRVVSVTANPSGQDQPAWVSLPVVMELHPRSYGTSDAGWSM
jgi:hypothetical protein